jgi:hypothetical protein
MLFKEEKIIVRRLARCHVTSEKSVQGGGGSHPTRDMFVSAVS